MSDISDDFHGLLTGFQGHDIFEVEYHKSTEIIRLYMFGSKNWRFAWVIGLISTNQTIYIRELRLKLGVKIRVEVRFRVR